MHGFLLAPFMLFCVLWMFLRPTTNFLPADHGVKLGVVYTDKLGWGDMGIIIVTIKSEQYDLQDLRVMVLFDPAKVRLLKGNRNVIHLERLKAGEAATESLDFVLNETGIETPIDVMLTVKASLPSQPAQELSFQDLKLPITTIIKFPMRNMAFNLAQVIVYWGPTVLLVVLALLFREAYPFISTVLIEVVS